MNSINKLAQITAFQTVLANYQPSTAARELLSKLQLTLLVGPSSSGRNTIINELLKFGDFHFIVSDTTRQPRVNNGLLEQNGREYWFRQEAELLQDLQAGQFLEAAIIHNQQVSGISIRELATAVDKGLIAINEIEVHGADVIHHIKPDAVFIFVLPPSFDEWMARMNIRGELPEAEVRRRVSSAADEIRTALDRDFYHFVINDTFKHATLRVHQLAKSAAFPEQSQSNEKAVAQTLLADILTYLQA